MLGRKKAGTSSSVRPEAGKKGGAKKRKWQESDDDASDEEKISQEEMDAWKAKMQEEEKVELAERDKQERELHESEQRRREAREAEARRKTEADALARKDADEAAKAAAVLEFERRRQEEELAPPGAHPPDYPGSLPPGLRADKAHLYKTTYCKRREQGTCQFGAACHFAHGERELRGRPPKGSPPNTMSVQLPPDMPRPSQDRLGPEGIRMPGTWQAPGWAMPGMSNAMQQLPMQHPQHFPPASPTSPFAPALVQSAPCPVPGQAQQPIVFTPPMQQPQHFVQAAPTYGEAWGAPAPAYAQAPGQGIPAAFSSGPPPPQSAGLASSAQMQSQAAAQAMNLLSSIVMGHNGAGSSYPPPPPPPPPVHGQW